MLFCLCSFYAFGSLYAMFVFKAHRIRLYPDQDQTVLFGKTIGCTWALKNAATEQRLTWSRNGQWLSYGNQADELKVLKADLPYFAEVPFHCLQQALRDVDAAFAKWRKGEAKRPRLKKRSEVNSFRFPDPKQFAVLHDSQHKGWGWLKLPKAGKVRARIHRPVQGRFKSITVSHEGDWWYASVLVEVYKAGRHDTAPWSEADIGGADVGVAQPVVENDGTLHVMPHISASEMRRKARLQKSLSRKKRGSRNRLKAKRALARFETKIARRRRDAQHKISHAMAAKHRVWAMEDCDFRAMTASACGTVEAPGRNVRQKAGLNRSILDVAPGEVRRQVGYKAAWAGGALVKVPAAYTSQECSACHRHPGDAPETTHLANGRVSRDLFVCPLCGFRCDADVNAARTIRWRGVYALQRDGKIVAGSSGGQPEAACGALCAPLLREQAACGKTALPSRRWHGHEAGTASSRPKRGQFHAA